MAIEYPKIRDIPLFIWSCFASLLGFCVLKMPRHKPYQKQRSEQPQNQTGCSLFFCSSAGEYEQAKPVMERLLQSGEKVCIVFFSTSGYIFAQKRGETIPFYLSPLDTVWGWKTWFQALQPEKIFLVRHELWPAFLATAQAYGPIFLINATASGGRKSFLKSVIKSYLLQMIDHVFVVHSRDQIYYQDIGVQKPVIIGDTKYDRVSDRKAQQPASSLLTSFQKHTKRPILIIGSAWPADLEHVLASYPHMEQAPQIICVPHDLSTENINAMTQICKQHQIDALLLEGPPVQNLSTPVLIVKQLGVLADLYSLSNAAFVGGALHHQVHNVLEPAIHLLPIAFGPKYQNSPEAIELIGKSLAHSSQTPHDLAEWWNHRLDFSEVDMSNHLENLMGASHRLLSAIGYTNAEKNSGHQSDSFRTSVCIS